MERTNSFPSWINECFIFSVLWHKYALLLRSAMSMHSQDLYKVVSFQCVHLCGISKRHSGVPIFSIATVPHDCRLLLDLPIPKVFLCFACHVTWDSCSTFVRQRVKESRWTSKFINSPLLLLIFRNHVPFYPTEVHTFIAKWSCSYVHTMLLTWLQSWLVYLSPSGA